MKQRAFSWLSSVVVHGALFCTLALAGVEKLDVPGAGAPLFRCTFAERPQFGGIELLTDRYQWPMRRCDHAALIRRERVPNGDTGLGDFVCEFCNRIFGRVSGKPLGWRPRPLEFDPFDE